MKAGRVRCGACNRVMYAPYARKGWDTDGQAAWRALERRLAKRRARGESPTGEELEALMAFRNGRGQRPPLARTAVDRLDLTHGVVTEIACPGKRCAIRYSVPSSELHQRLMAAIDRAEDLHLTAADRDRGRGAS